MIKKRNNKKVGEPVTLNGLFKELNDLFKSDMFVAQEDDPKISDIKSMLNSLTNGEACFEEEDLPKLEEKKPTETVELPEKCGGIVCYDTLIDTVNTDEQIVVKDMNGDDLPAVAFVTSQDMLSGVVDTICSMKCPIIVASENGGKITKAYVACGKTREHFIEHFGQINGFSFGDKGGIRRLSVSKRDGYDFVIGENAETRFIIFDESVCPATIPTDIVSDDRKWGKRMTSEIPKLIEKNISEKKVLCNPPHTPESVETEKNPIKAVITPFPETCVFEDAPDTNIKQPIIADIMKEFADAKKFGKVKDDTFVEFMKPENKEAVAKAVTESIAERQKPTDDNFEKDEVTKAVESAIYDDNDVEDEEVKDTNPDCFRCVVDIMARDGIDSVHFWTDQDGRIHCDVQIKTIYEPEPTNPNE